MKRYGFELSVAIRHLRAGKGQTILTFSTVAAGVFVIIFVSALIFGLRQMYTALLTDLLPHVTISPVESQPKPVATLPGSDIVGSQIVFKTPQVKNIDNWPAVVDSVWNLPHVAAVAPAILSQGFASRGGKQVGMFVFGADPEKLSGILNVRKYITQGRYIGLGSDEVVISYKLQSELGIAMGDRVRITSDQGVSNSFLIVGIYDNGQDEDRLTAYITLRAAQSLYRTGTSVGNILVRADDLFQANSVADSLAAITPYKIDSWSRQYPQFVTMLQMQSAVAIMISGFTLLASAFGISSVLVVSVLQKGKQIGILKSMGATRNQIFRIFLFEGVGIALLGSTAGALGGWSFAILLGLIKRPPAHPGLKPAQMWPMELPLTLALIAIGCAIVTTVIAAGLPARRAASVDPVQVMR